MSNAKQMLLVQCFHSQFAEHCLWSNLFVKFTHWQTQNVSPESSCDNNHYPNPKELITILWRTVKTEQMAVTLTPNLILSGVKRYRFLKALNLPKGHIHIWDTPGCWVLLLFVLWKICWNYVVVSIWLTHMPWITLCWNVSTNPITITRIFPHWPMEQI